MAILGSEAEIFLPEPRITKSWASVIITVTLIAVGSVWFSADQSWAENTFISIGLVALSALSLAHQCRFQIELDSEGLIETRLLGVVNIKWNDVDDLVLLKNITLIKSSTRDKSISIFHPEKGNIFHSFGTVKDHERLREMVISRSMPYLRKLWSQEKKERVYKMPSPSAWLFLIAASPMLIPFVTLVVFGGTGSHTEGSSYLFLFSPFVVVSIFVAYRSGLLSRKGVVVLNDQSIYVKNGVKTVISWDQVSGVVDNRGSVGLGSIIITSYGKERIVIPKSAQKFSDLAFQLKKRLPNDKFQFSFGMLD